MLVSLKAEEAIVKTTQEKVKDLASAIQISVQELTSVGSDRSRPAAELRRTHCIRKGLEVSIASSKDLIINSSNPKLIGAALNRETVRGVDGARAAVPAIRSRCRRSCWGWRTRAARFISSRWRSRTICSDTSRWWRTSAISTQPLRDTACGC